MHKRVKLLQTLVIVFAALFSILLISALIGRHNTTPVVIIADDQIDVNKPLDEQTQHLTIKEVSTKELQEFNQKLVESYAQLKGAKLKNKLSVGSPIPVDLLSTTKDAGQFAYDTPKDHSVFLIPSGLTSLPPGVEVGDKIDIKLIFDDDQNKGERFIGDLVQNAKIANIADNNIWVYVTSNDFNKLSVSREFGTFVLTLPGVKEVGKCSDVKEKILSDRQQSLAKLKKSDNYRKANQDIQNKMISDLNQTYQLRLDNAECTDPGDAGQTINSKDIKDSIKSNGQTISNGNSSDVFSNNSSDIVDNGKSSNSNNNNSDSSNSN